MFDLLLDEPNSKVVGIDISSTMIDWAEKTHIPPRINHKRKLQFMCLSATAIEFDQEFDFVTSFNALHWISRHDHKKFLPRVFLASRHGGRGLFMFHGFDSMKDLFAAAECVSRQPFWAGYFDQKFQNPLTLFHAEEYAELLKQSGFLVNSCSIRLLPNAHEGRDGLLMRLKVLNCVLLGIEKYTSITLMSTRLLEVEMDVSLISPLSLLFLPPFLLRWSHVLLVCLDSNVFTSPRKAHG